MTFEIGKSYYDAVGRRWKIIKSYILNLDICPLVNVDTPIEEWLKSLDKEVNE